MRAFAPRVAVLVATLSAVLGCGPSSTPGYPAPDFQVASGDPFPLRAGDLALVAMPGDFLYVSVQSFGLDTRCPPDAVCAEPGHLVVRFELEDSSRQGSAQILAPPDGDGVATFGNFEIRSLQVEPPGRESRILPTDYVLVLQVTAR